MEFKGTKGKWEKVTSDWDFNQSVFLINTEQEICDIKSNSEESKFNALLISKAPEMLDMLKTCKDAMLELMNVIENSVIIDIDKENDENNGIYQIAREIQKFNKEYSVKKSIEHDEDTKEDGGIEFDLSTVFDDIFLNKKEEL